MWDFQDHVIDDANDKGNVDNICIGCCCDVTLLMSNDNDIRIIDCNHDDDDCGHLSSSERGVATTPASYKTTSLSSCHRDLPPAPGPIFLGDQTQLFRFHQFKLRLDCIEHTLNLGVVLKPYISLMLLCSYVDNLYHQPSVYFILA